MAVSVDGGSSQDCLRRSWSESSLTSLRYGNELVQRYRTLRDAATILDDHFLRVENRWLKMKIQIDFLRSIWKYDV